MFEQQLRLRSGATKKGYWIFVRRIIWYNNKRKLFKHLRNDWFYFSYTAAKDGLYLVSSNVKLQSASEKDSEFTLTVAVNSDPNTFTDQNGIQDYIQCNTGPPLTK